MTMSDVAAQVASIFVSALGLVIFKLIARYLPDDPPPVPRSDNSASQPEHGDAQERPQ